MTRFLLRLFFLALLTSCAEQTQVRLDREAAGILRRQQDLSLGVENPSDPRPVPAAYRDQKPDPRIYQTQPPTVNPSAQELPAQNAPATQPEARVSPEAAEGPITTLDLEGALAYAIGHAPEYRNRKDDLFLSVLVLLVERHLWGPRLFETVAATFSGVPEAGDHDHTVRLVHELGVTQRLPYGGDVSASALVDLTQHLRDVGTDTAGAELALRGTLPLLRGAGMVAREDLIQAERNLVYAVRTFERFRREFLVRVATDYYSLTRQQAAIRNLERQVANFQWLSLRIEAFARAGREPYFEVQNAQQQLLFARNNLLNAREAYASDVDVFKLQIGMPIEQRLAIAPSELIVPQPALDPVQAVLAAHQLRLDLQTARDLVDDARRGVEIAKNELLPDLNLFGSVNLPTDSHRRIGGFDLSADGRYEAAVTLGVPLDRRIEQLRLRRSAIDLERAQRSYTLSRDTVSLEVRRAVRQIEQARFTLELQDRNVRLAERRRHGVTLRLRTLRPRDYIEAEDDLLQALNLRDAAVRDLRVSILRYLLDTGQMRVDANGRWLPPARLVATDLAPTTAPATQPGEDFLPEFPPTTQPATLPRLQPGQTVPEFPPYVPATQPGGNSGNGGLNGSGLGN